VSAVNQKRILYQYLTALIILFLLAVLIRKGNDVIWINSLNSEPLDSFFMIITNLGDGLIFIPIVFILLFVNFRYSIMGVLICLLSGLVSSIFKYFLFADFERPKNLIDNSLLHFIEGIEVHGTHSFPSGHTITAFCVALFITFISKNKIVGVVCLITALLVGYSRIYLLQHFLVDVAAGAIIGCLCTCIIWYLFESYNNPEWMNRKININFRHKQFDSAS
jgi:membrane-associated phospholipid phosphatase